VTRPAVMLPMEARCGAFCIAPTNHTNARRSQRTVVGSRCVTQNALSLIRFMEDLRFLLYSAFAHPQSAWHAADDGRRGSLQMYLLCGSGKARSGVPKTPCGPTTQAGPTRRSLCASWGGKWSARLYHNFCPSRRGQPVEGAFVHLVFL
jgi:hypothetical protein